MEDDEVQDVRRRQLQKWVDKNGVPKKEKSYFSQLLKSGYSFGETAARRIEKTYGMQRRYLDTQSAAPAPLPNVEPGPPVRGQVPLISWIRAGQFCETDDQFQPGDAEVWMDCPKRCSPTSYALRVRGDSMTSPVPSGKSYPEGCIIFVDPEKRSPVNGDRIIACVEGASEVTFKVFVQDAGKVWLKPINPQHPSIFEPFKVVGTVIGKWEDD